MDQSLQPSELETEFSEITQMESLTQRAALQPSQTMSTTMEYSLLGMEGQF